MNHIAGPPPLDMSLQQIYNNLEFNNFVLIVQ